MAFPSTGAWSEAVSADFNRDGLLDVAAVSEGIRGVEFLVGTGTGIFNTFRVDTTDAPLALRTADFDGDLITDLSVIERGGGQQTISILFGDPLGAPSPPVPMGSFTVVSTVEPANLAVSAYAIDYISDLIVVSQEDFLPGSPRSLAFFVGSSERRMLAPFIFADNAGLVEAVVVGKYDPDDTPDVLAVTEKNVWFLQGSAGAQFRPEDVPPARRAPPRPSSTRSTCAARCGSPAILDGDGSDEVIAVDHSHDTSSSCHGRGASPAPRVVVAHVAAAGLQVAISSDLFEVPGELTAPSHCASSTWTATAPSTSSSPSPARWMRPSSSRTPGERLGRGRLLERGRHLQCRGLVGGHGPARQGQPRGGRLPQRRPRSRARARHSHPSGRLPRRLHAARTLSDTPVLVTELRGQGSLQAADINGDGLEDLVVAVRDNIHVFLSQPHDHDKELQ